MSRGLDPSLAQRLVDQVGASIAHNVNLMDADGLIIGSRDPDRVGTPHEGAARAATSRRPVRISSAEATEFVRPGVNLPLVVDGDVLGVVGVTGDPDEVGELASLVLLSLRLILDVEQEQDARAARDGQARELLAALAAGPVEAELLRARSVAAGAALEPPYRVMALFEPPAAPRSGIDGSPARRAPAPPVAAARLQRAARADPGCIAVVEHDALWVLQGGADSGAGERLRRRAAELDAAVLDSGIVREPEGFAGAVRRVRLLLAVPALVPSAGGELRDLEAESLVAAISPAERRSLAARVIAPLGRLERATARALVEAGGSLSLTAAELGLHRNSLAARVAALARATGRDPRAPAELRRLALGLLAARATAAEEFPG
ncbi:hypothetical protein GCM10009792_16030 [Microcella alkalica]|uniref:Carbohydrate diacid regulator n=1 Tax=Microcella alkalica TaxID=355930 RepID=A0A839EDL9_9MICO|nr:sugar diacid recognition domain-containing protein [Microcella alkalica]MBA8848344.1 carbohydrate diacid regulator [Microcella alkalica]